jgi:predicted amidophosphoribosyltransferase
VIPISYSVAHEGLHTALADYKRRGDLAAHRDARQLAATLWRFLAQHEACVATAACAGAFDLVTTVPSGDRDRDRHHPLREIVSELVGPSRDRHARVLRRTTVAVEPRHFDPRRYSCDRALDGANVLLIDDTWTTGASAQSAAAALQAAGAGRVAAVVIGRHLNRAWGDNDRRLHALGEPFDWESCAACRREGLTLARAA